MIGNRGVATKNIRFHCGANTSNRSSNVTWTTTDNSIQVLNRINRVSHSGHAGHIKRIGVRKNKGLRISIKSIKDRHEVRSRRIELVHVEHAHRTQAANNVDYAACVLNLKRHSILLRRAHRGKQIIHTLSHLKRHR